MLPFVSQRSCFFGISSQIYQHQPNIQINLGHAGIETWFIAVKSVQFDHRERQSNGSYFLIDQRTAYCENYKPLSSEHPDHRSIPFPPWALLAVTGSHHHCIGPVWDRQRSLSKSPNVITVLPLSCSIPLRSRMDTPGAVWWFSVAPWHIFRAVSCRFETCSLPPTPFGFAFTRQHFHSYRVSRRGGVGRGRPGRDDGLCWRSLGTTITWYN